MVLGGGGFLVGLQEGRAHGKLKVSILLPPLSIRQSLYGISPKTYFFTHFSYTFLLHRLKSKMRVQPAELKMTKKKPGSDFGAKKGAGKNLSSKNLSRQFLGKKLEFSRLNSNFNKN